MAILLSFLQPSAVAAAALAAMPFGMSAPVFWMYVCAAVVLALGLIRIFRALPQQHGLDKMVAEFARLIPPLFFAVPMAVFGSEHFTLTADIARLVPRWIPAHTFWVYAIGAGFILAGLSIATGVRTRLAAAMVGMTFLIFVLTMDIPGIFRIPHNRFAWALGVRQLAFSGGALALAMSKWSSGRPGPRKSRWMAIPRFFVGIPSVFYGVEELLHPQFVPGIPLQKLTPVWIHGRMFVGYLVGAVLMVGGLCLVANLKARLAATVLGLAVLLAVMWVYLPMLMAAPKDIVAMNYFFDTLLFCGTLLLVAGATEK